jgi:hypothetical protein
MLRLSCRATHLAGDVRTRVVFRNVGGSQAAENQEDEQERADDDDDLASRGAGDAKLLPLTRSLASVALQSIQAELVVDHTAKGDGVAERLETRDRGAPDQHGSGNKQDILQYTTESHDQRRRLANLLIVG